MERRPMEHPGVSNADAADSDVWDEIRAVLKTNEERIAKIYDEPNAAFIKASNAEERTAAAPRLAPGPIVQRMLFAIDDVENWLMDFYDEMVCECAGDAEKDPQRWLYPRTHVRWLRNELKFAMTEFEAAQRAAHEWAEARAAFSRENTIGAGLRKGIGDVLSFFGGPKAMAKRVGDAVNQFTTISDLEAKATALAEQHTNATDLLFESLERIVEETINRRLIPALREIQAEK